MKNLNLDKIIHVIPDRRGWIAWDVLISHLHADAPATLDLIPHWIMYRYFEDEYPRPS